MPTTISTAHVDGAAIEFEIDGVGPALLLVHGFPHTRALWALVIPELSRTRRVISVDLRGCGGSSRPHAGFDAETLSKDLLAVLDVAGEDVADVAALDAGVPPAFVLALTEPQRVRRLVLMESTLGTLPGAEAFSRGGPPWWFGFHAVPGLAETVVAGHEGDYLNFFYRSGTHDGKGIDPAIRDQFVSAYTGIESLRAGFEFYRAMPQTSAQLADLARTTRLTVPTLAIGSRPVGGALLAQLQPVADDVRGELIADCGHIIPLDRPAALIALLSNFLRT